MVETLENGAIDDREITLDFLGRIQDDIGRMTALVDELLELSSLESGQMPLHMSAVDLREAAGAIVERFSLAAAAKGVAITREVSADTPRAMADPAKLDQILTNLLENALRFTPRGGAWKSPPAPARDGWTSRYPIPESAYRRSVCRTCSSAFSRRTDRAATAGRGWDWR